MSKPSKLARSLGTNTQQSISLPLNVPQIKIVNRLYATGLYGNSPSEVCNRIFCEALMKHANPI